MTAKAPGAGEAWGKRNGSEPLTVKSTKLVSGFVSTSSRVSGGGHFPLEIRVGLVCELEYGISTFDSESFELELIGTPVARV